VTALMVGERATYDIGVDIDDVIHPWYDTAHALSEAAGITNGVTPTTWRMADEYGCDIDVWAKVLDDATMAGTLYGVPPIPGRVEALRRLHFEGHRIYLITARGTAAWQTPEQRYEIRRQTAEWVAEFAVPHVSLTFASNKALVAVDNELDYFIDDGVHNFQDLEMFAEKCQTYLMTAPHNGDFFTPFRLGDMDEFADLIIEASRKGVK
jgi:5'(3')-deoxyribonucleotidase